MIGLSIGNYKILEQLNGTETFGVYKAVDMLLNRNVYIKVPVREFMNQPDIAERFRFEAATLAKLVHPNIPTLHSLTTVNERLFMITEFLEGESLDKVLRRQRKLSCEKTVSIFTQVLDCLEFAHSAGIAHGDFKTDNIFLTETGDIKVLGFGMSENFLIDETNENNLSELTPKVEFNAGKDIYAVGKMIFETLTGENLPADNIIEAERLLRAVNPAIPEKVLEAVINIFRLQMYGKFQSAAALSRELQSSDLKTHDLTIESDVIINTEFLGRSGNKSAAEYSIDFSRDDNKFFKNAFKRSRSKASEMHKNVAETPVNWKLAQKNIWVGGAGILAIVALHFFFQFSFINNDAVEMVKELNKPEQIAEIKPFAEVEQVEKVETFPEIDPFVNQIDDKAVKSETNYESNVEAKPKKSEFVKKPEIVSQPVQVRPKTAPPRNVNRNKEMKETRAERLRRAEKILTGA